MQDAPFLFCFLGNQCEVKRFCIGEIIPIRGCDVNYTAAVTQRFD